jgi:hypothetical protein
MTITSSGARCDVCGDFILPFPGEWVNPFKCTGIGRELHACNKCKKIVLGIDKDWKKLPDGPLRQAFERVEKEQVET